jgi:hypothetical protein
MYSISITVFWKKHQPIKKGHQRLKSKKALSILLAVLFVIIDSKLYKTNRGQANDRI